jgi:hypothetical protein
MFSVPAPNLDHIHDDASAVFENNETQFDAMATAGGFDPGQIGYAGIMTLSGPSLSALRARRRVPRRRFGDLVEHVNSSG